MPFMRHGSMTLQSRPRAALSRLSQASLLGAMLAVLAGCTSTGSSPLLSVFSDALVPADDASERAAEIPYASLIVDAGDRQGLIVLGAQANAETYWPTGNSGLITLRHEGLHVTVGLIADLLDTHYSGLAEVEVPWRAEAPVSFAVTRAWQDAEGLPRRLSAQGNLHCGPAQPYELPLATLTLEPCEMTLRWENGATTEGQLWREPQSRRLWAGEEQPWPDGPTIRWEVARQWW